MTLRRAFATAVLAAVVYAAPAFSDDLTYVPVDRATALARLKGLERENAKREAELKQLFAAAGCGGEQLTDEPVAASKTPNVICTLPGASDSTIVVGAHYDHVSTGMGAIDNWTGASLLPSLYQTMAEQPRRHTFVFIGFTDEEKGLVGSQAYVNQLTAGEKAKIFAMVNFDSLGLGPTEAWGNVAAPGLLDAFVTVARALRVPPRVLTIPESDADSDSFSRAGIPAITLHAIEDAKNMRLLHTANDQLRTIDENAYYGNYRFAATYLLLLDSKSSLPPRSKPKNPPAKQAGSGQSE